MKFLNAIKAEYFKENSEPAVLLEDLCKEYNEKEIADRGGKLVYVII